MRVRSASAPAQQAGAAPRRALGDADVALDLGRLARRGAAPHQLQAAGDGREQVVEVVRQPAGELADGLQLLALAQLFLGGLQFGLALLLLGDVARGGVVESEVLQ